MNVNPRRFNQDRQGTSNVTWGLDRVTNGCSGKAVGNTYAEFVFAALGVERAMRMGHTVICDLSISTIFFHVIS